MQGARALGPVVGLAVWLGMLGGLAAAQGSGEPEPAAVLWTRIADPITTVIADHLEEAVDDAAAGGYEALVVEIDTPGGLDVAMRDIVQAFLAAEVPVVTYVSPSGGRAASAGALIAWSSHVVAMAPGTTIGAATPVDLSGGEVGDKIVNDAAAYARAVAEERGRNVEVAAEAVTEGRALSATEAVEEDAADLVVEDRAALLDQLDGIQVTLASGAMVRLDTAGATVEERDLSFLREVLQLLADPNLAFLFLSVGTLGLIYELATPGVGIAAGVGVVLVLLAFVSLAVIPVDAAGLLFLALAGLLFAAELFAPGIGVAAAMGSVSLVLAGLFLFRDDAPGVSLSLATVLPTSIVVGVLVIVAGRLALRARGEPSTIGVRTLVGSEVTVAHASGTAGQALVEGAWWNVRGGRPLAAGERVRVVDVDELDLVVEPVGPDEANETNEKETTS